MKVSSLREHWLDQLSHLAKQCHHLLMGAFSLRARLPICIHRHAENGWVDFYLGETSISHCHRLLDCQAKVGLYYQAYDLGYLSEMACPSTEIPAHLWQELQHQYARYFSKYPRYSRYVLIAKDEQSQTFS